MASFCKSRKKVVVGEFADLAVGAAFEGDGLVHSRHTSGLCSEVYILIFLQKCRILAVSNGISMSKQELKEKIREAVEQSEFRDDIRKVSLFGSHANGTSREDSDVDLLIEFTPLARIGLFEYAGIHRYFSNRLQKKVDIATPTALSKFIRDDVLSYAESVYEKNV